jgi:uncharacterized protein YdcH (DUF465 family)
MKQKGDGYLVDYNEPAWKLAAHERIKGLNKRIDDLERTVAGYQVKENELRKANLALKERLIELGVDYRELI